MTKWEPLNVAVKTAVGFVLFCCFVVGTNTHTSEFFDIPIDIVLKIQVLYRKDLHMQNSMRKLKLTLTLTLTLTDTLMLLC